MANRSSDVERSVWNVKVIDHARGPETQEESWFEERAAEEGDNQQPGPLRAAPKLPLGAQKCPDRTVQCGRAMLPCGQGLPSPAPANRNITV